MEKHYTQEKQKNGGYMTVFASLLFLTVMALLFVCLDGILLNQGKGRCKAAMAGAGEHLLANYDKVLARRYHLYFLDPRMEKSLQNRTMTYYEDLLCPSPGIGKQLILDLEPYDITVWSFGTMKEQECRYFIAQIKDYMKYDTAKDVLMELLSDSVQKVSDQKAVVNDTKALLEEKEAAVQETSADDTENIPVPSNSGEQKQAAQTAPTENPVNVLKKILKSGFLEYVTEDSNLSERKVSPSSLPSGSLKETGETNAWKIFENLKDYKNLLKDFSIEEGKKLVSDKAFLAVYGKEHFNYYGREEVLEDTQLLYELEYVLGGFTSDKENLEYVLNRLILLRFAMNISYVIKDPQWNEQALLLATEIVGISGSVPLIEGTKYIILCAVSFIEAVGDVKELTAGKKIPLLKTGSNFRTSLMGKTRAVTENEENKGLSYDQYLMILFLIQGNKENQCLRMQDLMELNIKQEEPEFSIDGCKAGVTLDATVRQKPLFLPGTYEHQWKENYTY